MLSGNTLAPCNTTNKVKISCETLYDNNLDGDNRSSDLRQTFVTSAANLWFLSIFGDRLKSHIIYSSYTPRLHHVGEDKCFPHARASHTGTTVARTGLPWPATPRCMASDLPQGRAPSGRVPPLVARVAPRPRRGSGPGPRGGRSVPDHRVGPPRSGG